MTYFMTKNLQQKFLEEHDFPIFPFCTDAEDPVFVTTFGIEVAMEGERCHSLEHLGAEGFEGIPLILSVSFRRKRKVKGLVS